MKFLSPVDSGFVGKLVGGPSTKLTEAVVGFEGVQELARVGQALDALGERGPGDSEAVFTRPTGPPALGQQGAKGDHGADGDEEGGASDDGAEGREKDREELLLKDVRELGELLEEEPSVTAEPVEAPHHTCCARNFPWRLTRQNTPATVEAVSTTVTGSFVWLDLSPPPTARLYGPDDRAVARADPSALLGLKALSALTLIGFFDLVAENGTDADPPVGRAIPVSALSRYFSLLPSGVCSGGM